KSNPDFYDFDDSTEEINVKCVQLSNFINTKVAKDIDLMKIDVEGAELEVLSTLVDCKHTIRTFHLEMCFHEVFVGQALIGDVTTFMKQAGYDLVDLLERKENKSGLGISIDGFFVKKDLL
ncbi:MAG: FkbM family methyltransferase, partial [Elusimicrobiota bacterium]